MTSRSGHFTVLPPGIISRQPKRLNNFGRHEINRGGLHGLAGNLTRDGLDPITIQVLEEIKYLPRGGQKSKVTESNFPGQLNVKAQRSVPPSLRPVRQEDWTSPGQLGFSGQNFSPLKLHRVFGRSVNVKPVLNFTGIHGSHIAYIASNVLIFFDYYHNTQSVLQGHQSKIVALARDANSKHIVTADSGKDTESDYQPPVLIVWNVQTGFPLKTIQVTSGDPYHRWDNILAIDFIGSGLAQYVAILHFVKDVIPQCPDTSEHALSTPSPRQVISIWNFGAKESNLEAHMILPFKKSSWFHKNLVVSTESSKHFVTYGRRTIIFYAWRRHDHNIISHQAKGHIKFMNRIGEFTAAIWIGESVLLSTDKGHIVEFKARKPLGLEDSIDPKLNIKEFRRFFRIEETLAITALVLHKNLIVVGDADGGVRFLDTKFRVLRWTRTNRRGVINSISFNLNGVQPYWKKEMRATYPGGMYDHNTFHREGISAVYDYTFGGTKFRVPSETTLERNPLHGEEECLDLVVGYEDGSIAYFHITEEKMDVILPEVLNAGTCTIGVCPTTTHVAICTVDSTLQLFDYDFCDLLYSKKIFSDMIITTLRFHPSGSFLVLANSKGTLYFRRNFTMASVEALQIGKCRIERLEFSSCGLYIGIYDVSNTVTLCNFRSARDSWTIKGKHQSHYQKIVDMCFLKDPDVGFQRFFSLGKDRRLVEYHLAESQALTGLKILNVTILEPTAIPSSMTFAPAFLDHGPLLHYATTSNKIRIFDQNELKIRKTCQSQSYGSPITRMILINPEETTGGSTKLILTIESEKLGIMKTPVDGNPFKCMAVFAHPGGIQDVAVGCEGREVFTVGVDDSCIFMWTPEVLVMENSEMAGGPGVIPFKRYLDFGLPAGDSVVGDIENIFYHMMLKAASNQQDFLRMSRRIPIDEIPTVMRTCGYFPTEQEVEQILEEAHFLLGLKYGEKQEEIGYEDFLVLFANHKDGGVLNEEVRQAFDLLGEQNDLEQTVISREKFVNLITTKADKLQEVDLPHFLPNFYGPPEKEAAISTEKKEKWVLKTSVVSHGYESMHSMKSDVSVDGEDADDVHEMTPKPTLDLDPSTAPFPHNDSYYVHMLKAGPSETSVTSPESQPPEDVPWNEIVLEMPRDITTEFFIQQLLPEDARGTLNLARDELVDDIHDLERISDEHPAGKSVAAILKRWKGRDEWRYFKSMFDKLAHDNAPIDQRLQAVVEMDYFCRTGNFPGQTLENEESEAIGEDAGEDGQKTESTYSLPADYSMHPIDPDPNLIPQVTEIADPQLGEVNLTPNNAAGEFENEMEDKETEQEEEADEQEAEAGTISDIFTSPEVSESEYEQVEGQNDL